MNIQEAIDQLKKLPPNGRLMVASQSHGGSVPLQGFVDLNKWDKEPAIHEHWIDVVYCDDNERSQYGLTNLPSLDDGHGASN